MGAVKRSQPPLAGPHHCAAQLCTAAERHQCGTYIRIQRQLAFLCPAVSNGVKSISLKDFDDDSDLPHLIVLSEVNLTVAAKTVPVSIQNNDLDFTMH